MRTKLFDNPWWIVFGSIFGMSVSTGPILIYPFGVVLKPLSDDMGWSRATVAGGLAVAGFATAFASPLAGELIDRFGIKRITLLSICLFSLSLASIALMPNSIPLFLLGYAVIGITSSGITALPYTKSISAYIDNRRGLALGIAIAGGGLGSAVAPQVVRLLLDAYGWRGVFVGLGLIHFIVAFPSVALFIREPRISLKPTSRHAVAGTEDASAPLPGVTAREALTGSLTFWLIAAGFFIASAGVTGAITHIVPLLTDAGVSVKTASLALSTVGTALIVGRLFSGFFADRVFAPYITVVIFMVPAVGVYVLHLGPDSSLPFLGAFLMGFGGGGESDLLALLTTRYFGLRSYGTIFGILTGIFLLSSKVGPLFVDLIYGATRSYNMALAGVCVAFVVASLLILRLGAYAFPPPARAMIGRKAPTI